MTLLLKLIIIPIIAAAIGWITNKIAVWLLFNPKDPIQFLGITIQGVFPKRQIAIAERIGNLVAHNLLDANTLHQHIFTEENVQQIQNKAEQKMDDYLNNEFKERYPLLSMFLWRTGQEKIKAEVLNKVQEAIIDIEAKFPHYLENKVDIQKLVSKKISALDVGEVNGLMNQILKDELKFIEWTGAILGFIIGLIQVLLLELLA